MGGQAARIEETRLPDVKPKLIDRGKDIKEGVNGL
jgi:hypothetical protein